MFQVSSLVDEILNHIDCKFLIVDNHGKVLHLSKSLIDHKLDSPIDLDKNYFDLFPRLEQSERKIKDGSILRELSPMGETFTHEITSLKKGIFLVKIKESEQPKIEFLIKDVDLLNQLRQGVVIWNPGIQKIEFLNEIMMHWLELDESNSKEYHKSQTTLEPILNMSLDFLDQQKIRTGTGKELTINVTRVPIYNTKTQLFGFIIENTSPYQNTIKQLLKSTRRFKRLFHTMAQGVVYHRADGKIIDANKAATELLGLSLEEIKGLKPVNPLWKVIHPDGSEFPGDEHPAMISLTHGLKIEDVIMGVYHPKKQDFVWLLVNSQPVFTKYSKRISHVIATFTDITRQILAEQKLRKQVNLQELLAGTAMDYIHIEPQEVAPTIQRTLQELGNFMNADRSYIFEYDLSNRITSNTYEWCAEGIEPQIDELQEVPFDLFEDWIDTHLRGEIMQIDNVADLPDEQEIKEVLASQDIQSLVAVPIMQEGKPWGFIGIDSVRKQHSFTQNEINLVKVFAAMLENIHQKFQNLDNLNKRIKELSCIFNISDLTQKQNQTSDKFFSELVKILPSGFNSPLETNVRLIYDGQEFRNREFKSSNNILSQSISIEDSGSLSLEIHIPESKTFLDEEKQLIKGTLLIIQKHLENQLHLDIIKKNSEDLQNILSSQTNYLVRFDQTFDITFANNKFLQSYEEAIGPLPENGSISFFEVIAESDRNLLKECISKASEKTGEIITSELACSKEGDLQKIFLWEFVCINKESTQQFEIQGIAVDITLQKQAENALAASEERFRSIADNSGFVVWEIDNSGRYTYLSEACHRVFGYEENELLGTFFFDLFPEDKKEEFKKISLQLLEKGRDVKAFENPIQKKNGEIICVRTYASPILDALGNVVGFRGADGDITAEKKAKEELLKFEIISDQAQQGNVIIDTDGIITYCNEAFASMHGYQKSELIGQKIRVLHTPEQLEILENNLYPNDLKNREFKLIELGRKRKDGSIFPSFSSSKPIFDESGDRVFNAGWVIDISEKKEQEERLLAILDAIPDMIFVNDREGNYLEHYDSKSGSEIGDFSHLVGQTIGDIFDKEWTDLHLQKIKNCLDTGKLITYEYPLIIQNETKFFESRVVKLSDTKVLRFIRDISQRVHSEREIQNLNQTLEEKIKIRTQELEKANFSLAEAKSDAEKANKAKSEFLSRMSHELRTPMNAILGFAQLLELTPLTEKQLKNLEYILKGGQHLLSLINEILDLSKIEAGKIKMKVEPIDLNELLEETIQTVQPFLIKKSIHLINNQSESLFVLADWQRLKQVLLNILNNAIKYNKANGKIEISQFEVLDSEHSKVRIEIKDTGKGIREEDFPKLFEPFERIGAEMTETEGTGLGLAVVKKLLELMQGEVGVESVWGQGSTFWIELPLAPNQSQQIPEESKPKKNNSREEGIKQGTVLYIEDNISNIQLVEEILQTTLPDTTFLTENYGHEGIKSCTKVLPDLVLLDIHLPDISGTQVLSELKSNPLTRDIPVIILTADAQTANSDSLKSKGAFAILSKPFYVPSFISLVKKSLEIKANQS
ncbi:PAS domain S-box protein [Algoriphagus formosus]|uniref:histidine kinase n=1 Tax=Algoriphagus formosus TaxID=2007308 RepID=A0A4V3AQ70_9BACT|nr:PAS domain S-box protein [Algoriphagus aquimaris]TDK41637.1 PAS domain S-box protein [Algoriphagus aquimaris]